MDSRTAAHVLNRIADMLELSGENRFKTRAYRTAASTIIALQRDDLAAPFRSGEIAALPGVGPATLAVIRDLVETGESSLFMQLREDTAEGLLEMLRIPGLGTAKIHAIHEGLDIDTVHELEQAARDGRLASLPRFGPRAAEKVLKGIAYLRETSQHVLLPHALAESLRLLAAVRANPEVIAAEVAGSVRRRREVVRDVDIVASCRSSPARVASSLAHGPAVREAIGVGDRSVSLRFVDGTQLDLYCVEPAQFGLALWRATGSDGHLRDVMEHARTRGFVVEEDSLLDPSGAPIETPDERSFYSAIGLPWIPPELRESQGEVEAAVAGRLPSLIELGDIRGVLHCHSHYSDGKSSIAEMAEAARSRGWSYLGITDHSQSAFYAGGLSRENILAQQEEIDALNEGLTDFRVLKGIEADILPCGRIDYDPELLGRFDYVIASVHSRFGMDEATMTNRVLRALDSPFVTILGHPTGRLLLTREPYAIDMEAVLDKAAESGVAVELNADPHRLDLDWRLCRIAREKGVKVEIGPDAHSIPGLDYMELGVDMARKAWLGPDDVLNTAPVEDVLARAERRRARP
jgi:DNA polymerase (family X)